MFSNPYSPYLFTSAITSFVMAMLLWRRRIAPGATPLSVLLGLTSVWALASALLLESSSTLLRELWFDILSISAMMTTPKLLIFCLEYTERQNFLSKRSLLFVYLFPVLNAILCVTTNYHHLFYANVDFSYQSANFLALVPGPFYWIYTVYSYGIGLFIFVLILTNFFQTSSTYRKQTATILLGLLFPFVGNVIYTLLLGVGKGAFDPTPMLFTVMGFFLVCGLLWFQLFDVIPVARHTLVEHMQDGVIVVDVKNRIVDVNPSALKWLNWEGKSSPIGKNVEELLTSWFEQFANLPIDLYVQTEVHKEGTPGLYFDLRVEPIYNKQNVLTGRLIVFRDITRQKMSEKALLEAHDRLRLHLKEIELLQSELREQVIRDPLTGLFNRRYMEETLEREISRAIRENISIGVCMADIDQFKSFNDEHGHKAGDLILKKLSEILTNYSRTEDVVCRYGGEEFLILMPGAELDAIARRAEDWRRAFEQAKVEFDGKQLSTTLSMGIAMFPQQARTSDDIVKLADEAMYLSKHNGRNQVSIAQTWGEKR